ncbi:glutamate--cysteine ligase [Actinomyces slackii]|uniref:Glutamate--cysteine ligase n=1 Tax=Actinomyces slackii TaxID=52774 RepID=A0A3S4SU98_9ACTO|nr:glutamate--cysteine ligase [Actinomyces slackii]VEG75224.1 Glutamate--cysteine ligase GshA [Actinomyces slackii]
MARDIDNSVPIESVEELAGWIAQGEKPASNHRIGTEHEKIPYYRDDLSPVPYEGPRPGIRQLLEGMAAHLGWEPIMDAGRIIGLHGSGGAISLEPGGQFELSGAPYTSLHDTADELDDHLRLAAAVAHPLGIGFLGLGMSPVWRREEIPLMPKSRYDIMTAHMPRVGTMGLDMMLRTASVQTNLDFSGEADMVAKYRLSLAIQPLVTALFANSPMTDGAPNGWLSMRSRIWLDTDPQRTGMLPFVFESGMGYERYTDYALDVPMYFLKRGDAYHDATSGTFRDLLNGRHPSIAERPTLGDWENHLSTLFPEVRLKRVLEMRGADSVSPGLITALPALITGLLYHRPSLAGAWDLVKHLSAQERQDLREQAPRLGLRTSMGRGSLGDLARDIVELARSGLAARDLRNAQGQDESILLEPLEEIVESGLTPAERLINDLDQPGRSRIEQVYERSAL